MRKKRKALRLQDWNYRKASYYYVTICTGNRKNYFGTIIDNTMYLNPIGRIAEQCWIDIPLHFENSALDTYIIMPNHIHGIIQLMDTIHTCRDVAMQRPYEYYSKISPKPKSLSTIVRSYRSAVTKSINKLHPEINFHWQSRFYDHIIRKNIDLNNIRKYIHNNIFEWDNNNENIHKKNY
jgi:REP element-mobilizing transposase RayT